VGAPYETQQVLPIQLALLQPLKAGPAIDIYIQISMSNKPSTTSDSVKPDFADLIEKELEQDPQSCALIAAARAGNHRLCTVALQYGDSVNAQNSAGDTALHIALDAGNHDVALFLLSR
jgi:ankyrin repeat protein